MIAEIKSPNKIPKLKDKLVKKKKQAKIKTGATYSKVTEWRSCKHKFPWKTKEGCKIWIRNMDNRMVVYKCQYCNFYHCGHPRKGKKRND